MVGAVSNGLLLGSTADLGCAAAGELAAGAEAGVGAGDRGAAAAGLLKSGEVTCFAQCGQGAVVAGSPAGIKIGLEQYWHGKLACDGCSLPFIFSRIVNSQG